MKKKVVFLASTRGSNMKCILEKMKEKEIKADPIAMLTDNPEAGAIEIAKSFGLKTYIFPFQNYPDKSIYHKDLENKLLELKPDLIVAAGYMRILKPEVVSKFKNKIINIHPSLLPSFPGLHAQKQAIEYGAKVSGCTTHFIDEGVDTGSIIMQAAVPIPAGMTEEELSKKILKEEHRIYPLTVKYFCEDKITIKGRIVFIKD